MSAASKLDDLYRQIPSFDCKPGCSDCCGPVPLAKVEWQRVKLAKRNVGIDCLTCDYLVDGKCSVYADRPFLCRLFGATADAKLACHHGCGPAKPLTIKQANTLTAKYMRLMDGPPAALTASFDMKALAA